MVIRIRKIHFVAVLLVAILISGIFTLKTEKVVELASSNQTSLPIVMYHHVTEKDSRKGTYVVKVSELKKDLDYIKKAGYTCVTVNDLIDYINGRKNLPKKIIMITFDDGFESIYQLVWPLLKERNMKAVVSPIGSVAEEYTENGDRNVNYAYMSWDELRELSQSDEFEVQSHTFDMHKVNDGARKGLSRMKGESEEAYREALTKDLTKMQKLLHSKSGVDAKAIVFPYGLYSEATADIIKKLGFKCSMVCEERINKLTVGDEDCLFNLGRFNRPSGVSSEKFFEKVFI